MKKVGTGGNWQRFDEKFDASIVKQKDLSCVAAVGEMLLRTREIIFTQDQILDIIGKKASIHSLLDLLNTVDDSRNWKGFYSVDESIVFGKEKFLAVLQEPLDLGHAVFVELINEDDEFIIKDSSDQTVYKMTKENFLKNWGGGIVYYEKNK